MMAVCSVIYGDREAAVVEDVRELERALSPAGKDGVCLAKS